MPNLTMPRAEAEKQLNIRIEMGQKLVDRTINSKQDLEIAEADYYKWNDFNKDLLMGMFDSPELSSKYASIYGIVFVSYPTLPQQAEEHKKDIKLKLTRLESIKERLPLYNESMGISKIIEEQTISQSVTTFLVHGRDEASKQAVARFLEKLELDVRILHELPSEGMTVIEKIEHYSPVAFVVVLLTPDDLGKLSEDSNLKPRARQNVVFELGYFIGKLGRKKVCALYDETIELPSDFKGVSYIPLDKGDAWKLTLAREIRAAGLSIDLNKTL